MKIWTYRLIDDPEQGFSICEDTVKSGKKLYQMWHDPYEGGEAYPSDWTIVNSDEYPNTPKYAEWKTFDDAYEWIVDNYGKVKKIAEQEFFSDKCFEDFE